MVTKYVDIDGKWGVLINWDFDESDWDDISALLFSFGMNRRGINRSLHILSTHNSGMAISNDDLRMTSIYIGKASSTAQWWSTLVHELKHCVDAIIDYYGETLAGEPSAYTIGYLMLRVVQEIAEPCSN